jgi:type II secretory pathway pseudopilin PulG
MTSTMLLAHQNRRAITLMEVLISIGILAIGLSSVVALIPAARSQAARAVVLDRAAVMAANGLADAVTVGMTRRESLIGFTEDINGNGVLDLAETDANSNGLVDPAEDVNGNGVFDPAEDMAPANGVIDERFVPLRLPTVVVDPLTTATSAFLFNVQRATLRPEGIYATTPLPLALAPLLTGATVYRKYVCEGRDDVALSPGASPEDIPANRFDVLGTVDTLGNPTSAVRSFEGRMSCLYLLQSGSPSGNPGRLSVVVFHSRDPSQLVVTGTLENGYLTVPTLNLGDRLFRDVVRPGGVLYDTTYRRLHQIASSNADLAGASAWLTLSTGTLLSTGTFTVQILPDSVGLAERPFLPEGPSEYTQ